MPGSGCGCAGSACGCAIESSVFNVAGIGSAVDPYRIEYKTNGSFQLPRFTTGTRPTAAAAGQGAVIYNTTTSLPNFSDGTAWRTAAGAVA